MNPLNVLICFVIQLIEWIPPDIEAITDLEYVSLFVNGGDELYQYLYVL